MKHKITLILFLFILFSSSQTISLDSSFGTNGIVKIPVDGEVRGLEFLDVNTGFLVYSKLLGATSSNDNIVFKLNLDGSLDSNFGTNGKLVLPNYSGNFKIYQQTNKILVAFTFILPQGQNNNQKAIIRYDLNGNLDTSFGINGEVRIDITNSVGSNDYLVILQDNSILATDRQQFMKYTADGIIDDTFGTNGVLNVQNHGNILPSNDGNLFFYNSLQIDKMDVTGNFINTFGNNGSYSFPMQNDYLLKANNSKTSFLELGDTPTKFYDLNSNGVLNSNFNTNGYIDLTTDSNTLEYYENFYYNDGIFYFVGYSNNGIPFIVCYDEIGNLITLNGANSYKESLVSAGAYTSVLSKNNALYAFGDEIDITNNEWSFVVSKYIFQTLSTNSFELENKIFYKNPIENELDIYSSKNIKSIEILTITGQKVKTSSTSKVNTSKLEKGIYIVRLEFENGYKKSIKILKK